MIHVQPFPPKKFFQMSSRDIEERRLLLERYLQSIVQNKVLLSSSYFDEFFLKAQRDTCLEQALVKGPSELVNLSISLLSRQEILLENVATDSSTNKLYQACASKLQLDSESQPYFNLFLYENKSNHLNLIRPLFAFESPYFSLKQIEKSHDHPCLVLKKSYWNPDDDMKLIDQAATRHLLFVQAMYEIEQSQSDTTADFQQQLNRLREQESFKEYILLARTWKFSGYILLQSCSLRYPNTDLGNQEPIQCQLAMGNNELLCYCPSQNKDISFKVTRIRCWKVNWNQRDLNITFEYLLKKDTLQWITLHTEQAALVSTCLQSMVDEILSNRTDLPPLVSSSSTVQRPTKANQSIRFNSLSTRTQSDLDRLNNNTLFDRGDGDDEL